MFAGTASLPLSSLLHQSRVLGMPLDAQDELLDHPQLLFVLRHYYSPHSLLALCQKSGAPQGVA